MKKNPNTNRKKMQTHKSCCNNNNQRKKRKKHFRRDDCVNATRHTSQNTNTRKQTASETDFVCRDWILALFTWLPFALNTQQFQYCRPFNIASPMMCERKRSSMCVREKTRKEMSKTKKKRSMLKSLCQRKLIEIELKVIAC